MLPDPPLWPWALSPQSGLPELELEAIDNQFGQPGAGDQIPWANNTVTAINQNKPDE